MATHISCCTVASTFVNHTRGKDVQRKSTLRQVAGPRLKRRRVNRCAREVSGILVDANDIPPQDVDLFLPDVGERELRTDIAREFATEFLASADPLATPQWPVSGIVYGRHSRVIIQLTVSRCNFARRVFFQLVTGSPFTYLSPTTLQALGFNNSIPESLQASVHGQQMTVYSSPQSSQFKDVNLLGSDFLNRERCQLMIDYELLTAELAHQTIRSL